MGVPTIERPVAPEHRSRLLPVSRLGRWAAALLLPIALFPMYWAPLGRALRDPPWIIVVPAAIALPGMTTAVIAIFRRHETSAVVRFLFWFVTVEVALVGALFLMMGLGGG